MNARIAVGAVACDPDVPSGLNRYMREVFRHLVPEHPAMRIYAASPRLRSMVGSAARPAGAGFFARSDFRGNLARLLWHQARLPRLLRRDGAALFYSPVAEGMLRPPCPQVITVHDLLPLRYPAAAPRLTYYYRWVLPRIIRVSSGVIVDSVATERDVRAAYGVPEVPIHVVPLGVRSHVFRPASEREVSEVRRRNGLERYILGIGDSRAYKNTYALMGAFLGANVPGVRLALVGRIRPDDPSARRLLRSPASASRIRFLGTVSDADLAALYSGAEAFVFPSLYEGFGLPPLEAMACGSPVIASNAGPVPEVCGDAAVYVDPGDTADIRAAIERVVSDASLRRSLRQRGLERARGFRYEDTARAVGSILRRYAL